jgi:hypothetical protein
VGVPSSGKDGSEIAAVTGQRLQIETVKYGCRNERRKPDGCPLLRIFGDKMGTPPLFFPVTNTVCWDIPIVERRTQGYELIIVILKSFDVLQVVFNK